MVCSNLKFGTGHNFSFSESYTSVAFLLQHRVIMRRHQRKRRSPKRNEIPPSEHPLVWAMRRPLCTVPQPLNGEQRVMCIAGNFQGSKYSWFSNYFNFSQFVVHIFVVVALTVALELGGKHSWLIYSRAWSNHENFCPTKITCYTPRN